MIRELVTNRALRRWVALNVAASLAAAAMGWRWLLYVGLGVGLLLALCAELERRRHAAISNAYFELAHAARLLDLAVHAHERGLIDDDLLDTADRNGAGALVEVWAAQDRASHWLVLACAPLLRFAGAPTDDIRHPGGTAWRETQTYTSQ